MTVKQSLKVDLIPCGMCRSYIALAPSQQDDLKATHASFYCPLGHARHYPAKNDAELLTDEQRKVRELKAHQDELLLVVGVQKREIANQKRKLARVEKGVCPECRRHCVNVERHMQNKHPEARGEA